MIINWQSVQELQLGSLVPLTLWLVLEPRTQVQDDVAGDACVSGVVTATSFDGSLAASNLTGALPAISGANLTNLTAGNLTGALPAIDGSNLTGISAGFS